MLWYVLETGGAKGGSTICFRDTVVEVEISLGSYNGQFNSAILVSVDQ